MSFILEQINGVTKSGNADLLVYNFGIVTIAADVTNNEMVLTYNDQASNYEQPQTIKYADITDKLGATDIEEYVDALATNGFFFNTPAVPGLTYTDAVALGYVDNVNLWNKFGFNTNVDTGAAQVIASYGGVFDKLTTADTIDIVSTSASDTNSSGTGLRQVLITGIDENRVRQTETVNLNGTTTVTTSNSWLGVNRVSPVLCGSAETAVGDISFTSSTLGLDMAEVLNGKTITQQAVFFVQANHTFLLEWAWFNILKVSASVKPIVTVTGWIYQTDSNANIEVFSLKIDTEVNNVVELNPAEPFPIAEKSIIYFTAETDKNDTVVQARFSGKEVLNR